MEYPRARFLPAGHGLDAARRLGRLWKEAGARRVVIFPTSLSSRIAGLLSGARERVGHGPRPSGRREIESALGLTRVVPRRPRGERHLEEEYLDLARAAGAVTVVSRALPLPPQAHERAETLLGGLTDFIALAPGARYGPAKRWPVERFAAVARAWTRGRSVVVGGPEDAPETSALTGLLGSAALDLTGRTDLPGLAAVLARAGVVVSNDSGVAHLAAALERPTIAVFGSTDPRWTAPRGACVTAVWERVRCAPCFRTHCPYVDAYACLRIVSPDRVASALPR